ncbi:hypothetical protein [Salana multivorans]|nr:hypothetical protein [Salana multivorans]
MRSAVGGRDEVRDAVIDEVRGAGAPAGAAGAGRPATPGSRGRG